MEIFLRYLFFIKLLLIILLEKLPRKLGSERPVEYEPIGRLTPAEWAPLYRPQVPPPPASYASLAAAKNRKLSEDDNGCGKSENGYSKFIQKYFTILYNEKNNVILNKHSAKERFKLQTDEEKT